MKWPKGDAGWQHVFGTRYSLNQYFLPKNSKTNDDIFSTRDSAALRYKHLYEMCYANVMYAITFFIAVLISCDFNLANIAFLTPGLWEMTGAKFWRAFLFELPFVLFRTVPVAFFLAMAIAYAIWGGEAKRIYYKMMKDRSW